MDSYLMGQDLWDMTCDDSTTMQEDPSKKAKCNTKFEEVLFAIKQSICDNMLERIEDMKTPKEA